MRRKRRTIVLGIAVFCGLILWPTPAEATLITIKIEAVVDSIMDDGNYLEGKIKVGDTIGGFFMYESTTPDTNPSIYVGDYEHNVLPYGISLSVGGFEFKTNPASVDFTVEIINDYSSGGLHDAYGILSGNNLPLSNGTFVDQISWWLIDSSAIALSSSDLWITSPVLEDWQENVLIIGTARMYGIQAHIASAVVIPEPTIVLLLGLGAITVIRKVRT